MLVVGLQLFELSGFVEFLGLVGAGRRTQQQSKDKRSSQSSHERGPTIRVVGEQQAPRAFPDLALPSASPIAPLLRCQPPEGRIAACILLLDSALHADLQSAPIKRANPVQAGGREKRMRRPTVWGRMWGLPAMLAVLGGLGTPAAAIYLDQDQDIALRARIYSRASIRTNESQNATTPTKAGQLVEHRNFYNPELDAKLTKYTSWMKDAGLGFLAPDDFSVRLAAWGFYDGVYDYGTSQFGDKVREINSNYGDLTNKPTKAWYLEGPTYNCRPVSGPQGARTCQGTYDSLDEVFPGAEVRNARDIYGHRQRVNELYFNYSKGPVFFRVGRQSISWGEADTIGLLDQNNPFDITLGAPGVFQDLEESRIPLWTVRTTLNLFDNLGPFSSGFLEAYWVPGDLDNNTGILPIPGASPYSVAQYDPQINPAITGANSLIFRNREFQFVLVDGVPKKNFENSRYGFRAQTVVAQAYTVSAWFYTHFPNAPVPVKEAVAQMSNKRQLFVVRTVRELTSVFGAATTFFAEPIDSIVRAEVEYFDNEPGFVPEINLRVTKDSNLLPLTSQGAVPYADIIRWELGLDRFFFLRALNPSNSFLIAAAVVGAWNLDETGEKDFRMNGQLKQPILDEGGRPLTNTGQSPDDYVQQKKVESFMQAHLQTDYLHGRLTPGITGIFNVRGTYALLPTLTYRISDWLLFDLSYVHIGGEFQQIGFFRDRDQIATKLTYQLN